MNFREIFLGKKKRILLGKDEKSNDELMKKFRGKPNIILHTESPGSPFGVIDFPKPTKKDISLSGAAVARYSQDWRDNKSHVKVNVFTGKGISKKKGMKTSLAATFLYARAIKPALLPLMVFYFGLTYVIVLTVVMIIFSMVQGLIVEKIVELNCEVVR